MTETIASRIGKLELFKQSLEKKIIIATTVASVLGISTLISGGFISSLVQDLKELTVKTDMLDEKLKQWDSDVVDAISQLDKKETFINTRLSKEAKETLSRLLLELKKQSDLQRQDIDSYLKEKKEQISKIGADEIIKKLNSVPTEMVVKSLLVKNSYGNTAFFIGTDNGGDGYFRLNTEKGEIRYQIRLKNNKPLSHYYNNEGKNVLILGVFNDSEDGFARIYDRENGKIKIELKSDPKGGVLQSYSNNGKSLVYLGPEIILVMG